MQDIQAIRPGHRLMALIPQQGSGCKMFPIGITAIGFSARNSSLFAYSFA